jgi:hypothetical protein
LRFSSARLSARCEFDHRFDMNARLVETGISKSCRPMSMVTCVRPMIALSAASSRRGRFLAQAADEAFMPNCSISHTIPIL